MSAVIAFYADAQDRLCMEGHACALPGRPGWLLAYGTIGRCTASLAERCVAIDVRAIVGAPERVVRHCGRERCTVTLALADGGTVRIALDVTAERAEAAIRKAGV
ncbi:MAG: hypothetical protein KGS47_15515 [Chloroflexi bacterium]|nr:hypothetical protein [Chloroflexota bacterium]